MLLSAGRHRSKVVNVRHSQCVFLFGRVVVGMCVNVCEREGDTGRRENIRIHHLPFCMQNKTMHTDGPLLPIWFWSDLGTERGN